MADGKKPEFSGLLLTDAKDYKERKTVGKVALWRGVETQDSLPDELRAVSRQKNKGKAKGNQETERNQGRD